MWPVGAFCYHSGQERKGILLQGQSCDLWEPFDTIQVRRERASCYRVSHVTCGSLLIPFRSGEKGHLVTVPHDLWEPLDVFQIRRERASCYSTTWPVWACCVRRQHTRETPEEETRVQYALWSQDAQVRWGENPPVLNYWSHPPWNSVLYVCVCVCGCIYIYIYIYRVFHDFRA